MHKWMYRWFLTEGDLAASYHTSSKPGVIADYFIESVVDEAGCLVFGQIGEPKKLW